LKGLLDKTKKNKSPKEKKIIFEIEIFHYLRSLFLIKGEQNYPLNSVVEKKTEAK